MTTDETPQRPLLSRFLRQCRAARKTVKIADSSGLELTGGKLLAGSLMLRRVLSRIIGADEEMVGVLLPPSVGATLANTSLSLMRHVSVNLNYTLTNDTLNACIRQAGIRHILTSRRVMDRLNYQFDAELVYLEDLKGQATLADKVAAGIGAFAMPLGLLERRLGLHKTQPDDLLTIIYTSGSTGEPKGVMLTHENIGTNTMAVDQAVHIGPHDTLLGVLPFFHSFGYTATLWLALTLPPRVVYHFNPLDGREVGKLSDKYAVSILMAAPTFLRTYLKRCTPEQMRALSLVITGAEKLPLDLAEAFREKFNVMPSEGYGTTELSPVVSVNVPKERLENGALESARLGTVGRPVPGVRAKIVNPDTREDLPIGAEGLLLVSGPNVMKGYYKSPEQTAEVMIDGWYNTGDFGKLHEDGFIEITGRQSRFSKIGGEMVPHILVEDRLRQIIERHLPPPEDDETDTKPDVLLAVTAVRDERKGERLIVLHKPLPIPVEEALRELQSSDLPNLWLPSSEGFLEVDEIPMLGTGKLDLKGLQILAVERFAMQVPAN